MPDCDDSHNVGLDPEEQDTVSFTLELSNAMPEGTKLNKRASVFINIEPNDDAEDERRDAERRKMLEFFMSEHEISWGQQFKLACQLGPSID